MRVERLRAQVSEYISQFHASDHAICFAGPVESSQALQWA